MSTLWTPDGERPIRRQPTPQDGGGQSPGGGPGSGGGSGGGSAGAGGGGDRGGLADEGEVSAEDRAAMAELQEELARTPVELVIANHAFGLFELAVLHLSLQPPQLSQARLAIDAFGALVEGLAGRLGDYEHQLIDGLANLRLAYVQLSKAAATPPAGS